MYDLHGIIFAYSASPELGELVRRRTAASIPFCGRYRLIDFALSSMMNAGIRDVGVIMQRDYQSLLDHIGSGKNWDMSRRYGGLRMLPPFGLPEYHRGNYTGTIEALNAVAPYVRSIPQKHIALLLGSVCANIDLTAAMRQHVKAGAEITAICSAGELTGSNHRYVIGDDGMVKQLLFDRTDPGEGIPSLEGYIINKDTLLRIMDKCKALNLYRFHKDAVSSFLAEGGKMAAYVHEGYAASIRSVADYYQCSMDMLNGELRRQLFPAERPIRTRAHEEVSTYYGENAGSKNSLVADNCIIEGSVENCIVFPGVRIARGAKLTNCIVMKGSTIGEWAELNCVISDKYCSYSPGITLTGNPRLPIVVPKDSKI